MRVLLIKKAKIDGNLYELSKKEENYLKNVLRIDNGTVFKAKDEKDVFYDAILNDSILTLSESSEGTFLDTMPSFDGHFQKIEAYQANLKGKKNEKVVREAQEAGCSSITFFSSSFTQVESFSSHDIERLDAVRKEAVQQSGAKVMEIKCNEKFEEALKNAEGRILILHQDKRGGTKSIKEALLDIPEDETVSVFIGSEGGFSDDECLLAESYGAIPVLLKTNILRAETAAIYAISAIQTLLND